MSDLYIIFKIICRSGIEEETDELEDLIRQIVMLFNEFNTKCKKSQLENVKSSYQKGFLQREMIVAGFKESQDQEINGQSGSNRHMENSK